MSTASPTAEVIVLGGGPVGSLTAYLLAQDGVDVVLVDDNEVPVKDYRASTFHPPTLDLLTESGVADALVEMGLPCRFIQYRDRKSGPVAELDLSVLAGDTAYPYRLQCEQFKLTAWLQRELSHLPNVHLALGASLTGLHTDEHGVQVVVTSADGDARLSARYAVGADGARSATRRVLDIDFPGYTHPQQFLVAGTRYDFKSAMRDIQSVNYTSDPDEWFLLLEIPDMWRIVVPVGMDVAADEADSEAYIQRCLRNICPREIPYEILVKAIYRVHQRIAATYRRGSVLLAGDAAHVNNPLGGMGLNGGIHDALHLTRALRQVLQEGADARVLDEYEQLRRPVAVHDISAVTERNKRMMEERDPAVRQANNDRLRAVCADPRLAYEYALEVSMIRSLRAAGTLPAPGTCVR